jgi:hypothetical protein
MLHTTSLTSSQQSLLIDLTYLVEYDNVPNEQGVQ